MKEAKEMWGKLEPGGEVIVALGLVFLTEYCNTTGGLGDCKGDVLFVSEGGRGVGFGPLVEVSGAEN